MYNTIIKDPASIIHITCLGDLVETIAQDGMHLAQIEYGTDASFGYGFDAVMHTVDIFEKWLAGMAKAGKKVYFKGIT